MQDEGPATWSLKQVEKNLRLLRIERPMKISAKDYLHLNRHSVNKVRLKLQSMI